ncbi:cyclin-dependent kinase inhibitor 2c [Anaeramoeba flamelloides]|uniref:Cyclin-dependent kinase inhibitor 2c n=1 Tax=Anaeramoeba flamelloides TaxID=1746091 RepID=A0ABQ8YT95_9EUKA|nr:cyclin-dependent kinase inhibitor 2c [Anaeramoeba flamelloides]
MGNNIYGYIRKGKLKKVMKIFESKGTGIGYPLIHLAVEFKQTAIIEYFLKIKEVEIDITGPRNLSPLCLAVQKGSVKVCKCLIKGKADVNFQTTKGYNALHILCEQEKPEPALVELLIKYGINKNAQTRTGLTPIHLAAINGHLHILRILVEKKANIRKRDFLGSTPLHLMCSKHSPLVNARLLISKGANINAVDNDGFVPLMRAIVHRSNQMMEILLENKCELNFGKIGCKQFLKQHGVFSSDHPVYRVYKKQIKKNQNKKESEQLKNKKNPKEKNRDKKSIKRPKNGKNKQSRSEPSTNPLRYDTVEGFLQEKNNNNKTKEKKKDSSIKNHQNRKNRKKKVKQK